MPGNSRGNAKRGKNLEVPRGQERNKKVGGSAAAPEPINDKQFRWSADDIDHDYDAAWNWNLGPKEAADLLSLLEKTSALTWQQVKDLRFHSKKTSRQRHHAQPLDSICQEAQNRLAELQLDLEEVFRLRLNNLVRVWGHLQGPVFRIVWYDRRHQVCPTED